MINQTRNNRALFGLMSFGISGMGFFICLTLLLALASASGQTLAPTRKAPRNEPLEFYDNPPAPPRKIETSPQMISQFGPFVSFQANVDANGNNTIGDAANECPISVDPTDGNKMTIAWRQFSSVLSNFRQAGWGYTTDGGVHWTFPGVLENGVFRSDPVTNSDEIGQFFYLSLQSDQAQSLFCDDLWRSTNGGQTWTLLSGERGGGGGDKEWFTIDKTNGPGHGFQYQADDGINCSGGGVEFQRSTDGGVTWQAPINIPNGPRFGTLDVDTNGNLFVGGWAGGTTFYCVRSSNAQVGNQAPTFDRVTPVNMGGTIVQGGINGVGLCGQLFLAIDRSGGPTNNNIYMLASVEPSGRSTTDVMFVRSTDGGLTFSAPVRVNDDADHVNKWHWFGTFSVAPNGRLDAVWYATRNDSGNLLSQLFYSYSTDAGVTWSANVAVSQPFNPSQGYPNQNKIGDYITMVSDATGGNVAYAATFNFNPQTNQHEEDVYYVRVFPGGQKATPTPTPTPTASPAPTCDSGLIQNEGFETGSFPPWVIDGHSNDPAVVTNFVHTGTHSAFAGGNPQANTYCEENSNEPQGDSSFYQQFGPVPAGATLSFWHKDCTNDSISFDWQDAYIPDSNGNILQTIYHTCDTADWTNVQVNMTPYVGQTVRIKFLVHP